MSAHRTDEKLKKIQFIAKISYSSHCLTNYYFLCNYEIVNIDSVVSNIKYILHELCDLHWSWSKNIIIKKKTKSWSWQIDEINQYVRNSVSMTFKLMKNNNWMMTEYSLMCEWCIDVCTEMCQHQRNKIS